MAAAEPTLYARVYLPDLLRRCLAMDLVRNTWNSAQQASIAIPRMLGYGPLTTAALISSAATKTIIVITVLKTITERLGLPPMPRRLHCDLAGRRFIRKASP